MTVVINGTTGINTGTGSLVAADSTTPTYLDLFEDTDNGSNYVRLIAPTSVASNRTITLPDGTGTVAVNGVSGVLVSGTAITLTNQTAPEFTGIPSWVKRVTLIFQGVSTTSTNIKLVQIGAGSYSTSGYLSTSSVVGSGVGTTNSTVGFVINSVAAADVISGQMVLTNISGNIWVASFTGKLSTAQTSMSGGDITLSGTLDRIRIISSATGSPSDQFDAGTINIMWE